MGLGEQFPGIGFDGLQLLVIMLGIVMDQQQLLDPGLMGDITGHFIGAVAKSLELAVILRGVLGVMHQQIGIFGKLNQALVSPHKPFRIGGNHHHLAAAALDAVKVGAAFGVHIITHIGDLCQPVSGSGGNGGNDLEAVLVKKDCFILGNVMIIAPERQILHADREIRGVHKGI